MTNILIPLYAAVAPFVAWAIEQLVPLPYLVEEILKGILIYAGLADRPRTNRIQLAFLVGGVFAVSESVFYLINILSSGDFWLFPRRLMFTIPLHVGTSLVMAYSFPGRLGVLGGLGAAITIHWLYNRFLGAVI